MEWPQQVLKPISVFQINNCKSVLVSVNNGKNYVIVVSSIDGSSVLKELPNTILSLFSEEATTAVCSWLYDCYLQWVAPKQEAGTPGSHKWITATSENTQKKSFITVSVWIELSQPAAGSENVNQHLPKLVFQILMRLCVWLWMQRQWARTLTAIQKSSFLANQRSSVCALCWFQAKKPICTCISYLASELHVSLRCHCLTGVEHPQCCGAPIVRQVDLIPTHICVLLSSLMYQRSSLGPTWRRLLIAISC